MNRFVKGNPSLCIGCRTCMIACVVAHEGKHIFEIDPNGYDFQPRIQVVKTRTKTATVQCHHCEDAPCVKACPVGAMVKGVNSVDLREDRCIGCRQCVLACPFGAVQMVEKRFSGQAGAIRVTAHKCDLCQSTAEGKPACTAVCPTDALTYYTGAELTQQTEQKNAQTAFLSAAIPQEQQRTIRRRTEAEEDAQ